MGLGFITEAEGAWTTLYTALQPFESLTPAGYYQFNDIAQTSKEVRLFD